mmetsp:Transcript_99268/g.276245  ORF Transcript_99268/g.276245 Transcript_99268/m.276245 type:complete len:270 (+) Transcript_99268:492-1301(+)
MLLLPLRGLHLPALDLNLLLVLGRELLRRHPLGLRLLLLLLVQHLAPLPEEVRRFGVLRPLALPLSLLPRQLRGAALLDVLLPLSPRLLLREALGLVRGLLLRHLPLHPLLLVVLHLGQACGLGVDHGVPRRLPLLEDLLLLRLTERQHLLLPRGVLLDLLLLPLRAQHLLGLDLFEVLVGLLRLLQGLDRVAPPLQLRIPLAVEVLDGLSPEELSLQHLVFDLPEALLLVLGQLVLLGLCGHLRQLLLRLLLLELPLQHPAVVLLLHF